ncbi:hypothetical protein Syun_010004 [Stephania yunnanensis]|uniref:Peroxisomal membrane protein PMP22 n=1 Tax=Stephania yunnanensis TaxID=152371 RepID=A0AAP0KI97_9MAGN
MATVLGAASTPPLENKGSIFFCSLLLFSDFVLLSMWVFSYGFCYLYLILNLKLFGVIVWIPKWVFLDLLFASISFGRAALTAGLLAGVSDSVAQKLTGIQKLQLKRLLLKVLFGFAYGGPFGHYLHILMDKIFKGKKDSKTVARKVLLEQLTSNPWNNMLFMLYYGFIVEGRPWVQVKGKIKKDYPSVQLTSWMFWPIIGWVNHQYMPLQFRVIFHSSVACCWGIFLNLRARSLALTNK